MHVKCPFWLSNINVVAVNFYLMQYVAGMFIISRMSPHKREYCLQANCTFQYIQLGCSALPSAEEQKRTMFPPMRRSGRSCDCRNMDHHFACPKTVNIYENKGNCASEDTWYSALDSNQRVLERDSTRRRLKWGFPCATK